MREKNPAKSKRMNKSRKRKEKKTDENLHELKKSTINENVSEIKIVVEYSFTQSS